MKINHLFYTLILVLILSSCNSENRSTEDSPVIFNHNETVRPGSVFGIQGHNFGDNSQVLYSVITGDEKKMGPGKPLTIVSKSDINISALIPVNNEIAENDMIAVWVKNGRKKSDPVFLNKARAVSLEFDEIMPGQHFRIFGRNLKIPGKEPVVRFECSGETPVYSKFIDGDPYVIKLAAPDNLTDGKRYKIIISNGSGGKWGESEAEETMVARPDGDDPYNLKVAWGTEFSFIKNEYNVKTDRRLKIKAVGDGKADDRLAIQQAIDHASKSGGGVVYLPTGTYRLEIPSGSGLVMRSMVVIKGDGYKNSTIVYGYGMPPGFLEPIGRGNWPDATVDGVPILWPLATTLSGLYELQVRNVNTSGIWKHSLKSMSPGEKRPGAGGSKFFVANCRFDLAVSNGLNWGHIDRFVIRDCIFEQHAVNTWPWPLHCNGGTNFIVRNNTIHYAAGRFGFNDSHDGIIENNNIVRLGDEQTLKGESGGFNIDYAKDIIIMNNRMGVSGQALKNHNHGETILSQGCNPEHQDAGYVSSATATTIEDNSDKWGVIRTNSLSSSDAVAIVAGRGTGQWRYILYNTPNTIKVDKPWIVVPDSTSRYVIMRWSAEDWLVYNNILEDNNKGISFYCGGTDVAIVGNKLTNSDGISVRSDQRISGNENGRYNLAWNTIIEGNVVVNNDGKRPAYIHSRMGLVIPDSIFGLGTIGMEIRGNFVQASIPNSKFPEAEGYRNDIQSRLLRKNDQPGIIGTIFENNKVVNADIAYRLSKNIVQTIIKDPESENVAVFSTDSLPVNKTPVNPSGTIVLREK